MGNLKLNHEVVSIDARARKFSFEWRATGYDSLVSSVPLPDLIPMIQGAPPDVVEAREFLACSTCVSREYRG